MVWCVFRSSDVSGVPVLSRGRHASPRDGASFMELASLLAGERWTDRPRCTHPVLAALARAVNELCDPGDRRALAVLVPDVIGLNDPGPDVTASLTLFCADQGLAFRPGYASLVSARAEALRCLAIARTGGWPRRLWLHLLEPENRALGEAVAAKAAAAAACRGDAALIDLLLRSIATARDIQSRAPTTRRNRREPSTPNQG